MRAENVILVRYSGSPLVRLRPFKLHLMQDSRPVLAMLRGYPPEKRQIRRLHLANSQTLRLNISVQGTDRV